MKNSFLTNIIHAPTVLFTLIRNVNRQRKFLKKNIDPILHEVNQTNDGSLDKNDFKKITDYYGLAVPCILGEALCALRGKKMSEQERLALTFQGAMTGLFDDFFDKENMSNESIKQFMEKPEELTGKTSRQKLFLLFYKNALEYSHDRKLTLYYLQKVYAAQIESRKQSKPGLLPQDEIKSITVEKGGVSVLFYRSALSNPIFKEEEDALYKMGGLMQFGNDIFDVYKDRQKNIDTLMTTAKHVNDVRNIFKEMMQESFRSFYKTNYKRKHINNFLRLVSMSLCCRCFVCLDQLEEKKRMSGNVFTPYQYSREDLICDMDKASNKWKMIKYFISFQP